MPFGMEMLTEIQESFLDPQKIVYIADSSLVTPDNLAVMDKHRMRFISRFPENYNLATELKKRAWSKGVWQSIGRLAQSEKGAVYHTQSLIETLEGRTYRFVVVHSSSKDARKAKAIEKQLAAELLQLQKEQKELEKRIFNCREDADRALKAFLGDHAGSARITLNIAAPDEKIINELHARASTFVLITSLEDEDRWPDDEILREYKGQTAVETRFRNLKSNPCIVDAIYVKSSRRAEALAYLFLLALIVAAFIEIKIRQELTNRKSQFLIPGKRLTDRPTMAMIFDVLESVLVLVLKTEHGTQRILPRNTDRRVFELLDLMGIDQSAYTKAGVTC